MILLIAGQKGGSGKTTLAVNIAKHMQDNNKSLLVIDADRQGIIANSEFNFNVVQHFNDLKKPLIKHKQQYKNIIVDVEGKDSEEARSTLLLADIVIVPFIPSQADLLNLSSVNAIVNQAKQLNRKLKCYAVINSANPHPRNRDASEAIKFIKLNSKLKPMQTVLHTRNSYRDMFAHSKSIFELKDKKAIAETATLIKELKI